MTHIVHVSDNHGRFFDLPRADVYVFTGDHLPNFVKVRWHTPPRRIDIWDPLTGPPPTPNGMAMGRLIDHGHEAKHQGEWMAAQNGLRKYLPHETRDAPVIVCRGNHDFTNIAPYFGGEVYEVGIDPTVTFDVKGLRFGGVRGINYIIGEWSDELRDADWDDRVDHLPIDLDVLVTHAPPQGILDSYGAHYGTRALRRYVDRRAWLEEQDGRDPLRLHLFGHVHEAHGLFRMGDRGTIFSNAATTMQEVDL